MNLKDLKPYRLDASNLDGCCRVAHYIVWAPTVTAAIDLLKRHHRVLRPEWSTGV